MTIPVLLSPIVAPSSINVVTRINWAHVASAPQFAGVRKGNTPATRRGIRFEEKVHDYLRTQCGATYASNVWFEFSDKGHKRFCEVDGIIDCGPVHGLILVEVKYTHTPNAWWQLWRLYYPVVKKAFPQRKIRCVEVCRQGDLSIPFPDCELIENVMSAPSSPKTGVRILSKLEMR